MSSAKFDLVKNSPADSAEAGFEFEITTPAGEKTGIKIKVRGDQSPAVRNHGRRVYQEIKMKEQQAKRRNKEYELDLDEAEEMSAEAAAVRTISWSGVVEDGKEVKFSKEEAKRIYMAYEWIRSQVIEQSSNVFNFQ
jgi:hypothetical protein